MGKDEAFPDSVKNLISANYDPVYKFHQGFLKEAEQRLAQWSASTYFQSEKNNPGYMKASQYIYIGRKTCVFLICFMFLTKTLE